jgi:hypothetical protein
MYNYTLLLLLLLLLFLFSLLLYFSFALLFLFNYALCCTLYCAFMHFFLLLVCVVLPSTKIEKKEEQKQ